MVIAGLYCIGSPVIYTCPNGQRTIDAWIDIDSALENIWDVLIDFPKWGTWNTFIPLVEGKLEKPKRIIIK